MLLAELLQDNTCCYMMLAYGGWHYFGAHVMQVALATPVGNAIYSLVMPLIA